MRGRFSGLVGAVAPIAMILGLGASSARAVPVEYVRVTNTQYGATIAGDGPFPPIFFFTGTHSPDCGTIYIELPQTGKSLVHSFSGDPNGCIIQSVSSLAGKDGLTKYFVTMADTHKLLVYDNAGNLEPNPQDLAGQPAGTSETLKPAGSALPPTVDQYIYITISSGSGAAINGAIYQSTISTAGAVSAPTLIFAFPSGAGGSTPSAPAVVGPDGYIYGVTWSGGSTATSACLTAGIGCGIVYRLRPVTVNGVTTWHEDVLRTFKGGADGNQPNSQLAFDAAGNIYGTTLMGGDLTSSTAQNCVGAFGSHLGCGLIFKLTKSTTKPWPEVVLHRFHGRSDGALPYGPVTLDANGNVFGTAIAGGRVASTLCSSTALGGLTPGCGVVFELAAGTWVQSLLHEFTGGKDGAQPAGAVTLDASGNIWGTTYAGGYKQGLCQTPGGGAGWAPGCGVVYEITP